MIFIKINILWVEKVSKRSHLLKVILNLRERPLFLYSRKFMSYLMPSNHHLLHLPHTSAPHVWYMM